MKEGSLGITRFYLSSILIVFLSSGCMMMGLMSGRPMMGSTSFKSVDEVQEFNQGQVIDQIIEEAVSDLFAHSLDISSIAVWKIKSQTAGLDVEVIRQKFIAELVDVNRIKVISRELLSELLEEHSLSLSGTINENSAVEIGNLIGVEGFIDGYASIDNGRLILSFTLVDTKSGVIIWAKTFEQPPVPPNKSLRSITSLSVFNSISKLNAP